jgi:phage repressor protein C with HTH and peptisase S24 domain
MAKSDPGEKIKTAREARGWSQADLGRRVGISQPAIKKIEGGQTKNSKYLPRIAGELALLLTDLDPGLSRDPRAPIPKEQLQEPGRDFPIHAAAEGGAGMVIVASEPVDWVPRPTPLARVPRSYGLLITGISMLPEYRPGDTALVNPNLPTIGGEVYIFYAEREGEARATIKELRRATATEWHVTQHNPKKDFTLSRREWQWAHRVIGKYSRQ